MTGRTGLVLALCLIVTGCSTPPDGCTRADLTQLRDLDARIAATERDIARGYRIEPAQAAETRLRLCAWPKEPVLFCTETVQTARSETRVPIDPVQSTRDLAALRSERSASVCAAS